jgi:hypothetical protein
MSAVDEPAIGDISAVAPAGVEKEPMLLLDTTGSMTWSNTGPSRETAPSRWSILEEVLPAVVTRMTEEDSQRVKEQAEAGDEDEGGLMTVTFAGGQADKIGDISPENMKEQLAAIRAKLGGGTEIMPGWNALNEVYLDEFGDTPQLDRPKMLAIVITDGEALDTEDFAAEMQKVGNRAYVVLAIMGYGTEHDQATAAYQKVADANDHVRLVSFGNTTDPDKITDAILSLAG